MPTSRRHTPKRPSPKSSQMPARTANITPKTAPIHHYDPPTALLKIAEMRGNERDFSKIATCWIPPRIGMAALTAPTNNRKALTRGKLVEPSP